MHSFIRVGVGMLRAVAVMLCVAWVPASAEEPILKGRPFYDEALRGVTMAEPPWLDIAALALPPGNDEIAALREWLLAQQSSIGKWPPRYRDDAEAIQLIQKWRRQRVSVEKLETALLATPETGALAVTFWTYGHNLDEPDAGKRAFKLLDDMQQLFPASALPTLLRGMLLHRTSGDKAIRYLTEAKEKTQDRTLLGLTNFTIAWHCYFTHKLHQSAVAFSQAAEQCPACVKRLKEATRSMSKASGKDPTVENKNPYYLLKENDSIIPGSRFYGFQAKLPNDWTPNRYLPYSPDKPVSMFDFNAPPLPDSGLIHAVSFFSTVLDGNATGESRVVLDMIAKNGPDAMISKIKPLADNSRFTQWYRIDTRKPVGKDDTITMIMAVGVIRPTAWTLSDHVRLAKSEGECELNKSGLKDGPNYLRAMTRVRAPIEFTVLYHASKGSYADAERRLKSILATLEMEDHAYSEVLDRPLPE